MKIDKRLVAYIEYEDEKPFIDIIQVSKKGSSFLYDGVWWSRAPAFLSGYCTNEKGNRLKINPLSHTYNPYANYHGEIEVKEPAKERYMLWLSGKIKP